MNTQDAVPQTLQEAILQFSDRDACLEFMKGVRWPDGVICPHCEGKEHSFVKTTRVWHCKACKKRFSIKVGTIMEDSPIGLEKWLPAFWLITGAKNGISSYEVQRALGVTQKTAWFMLHRIRLAMQNGSIEKMKGEVEADETFIGGKAKNMHKHKREAKIQGRGSVGKAVVMGLLERDSNGSKVRAKVVKDVQGATLQAEIRANVELGSSLYTDAWKSYRGLSPEYQHQFVDHAVAYVNGRVSTNGLENFWCLLKRTVNGTYVSVDAQHLFRYLDEQSFRFNNRKGTDSVRFLRALGCVVGRRLTYAELTGKIKESQKRDL